MKSKQYINMGFLLKYNAATILGSREKNQDAFLVYPIVSDPAITSDQYFEDSQLTDDMPLMVFAVCDGIGMFKNSGDAARAALESVAESAEEYISIAEEERMPLELWLGVATENARQKMTEYCTEHEISGSATITMLAISGDNYSFMNIGDSPAFIMNEEQGLKELSVRHNMAGLKRLIGAEPVPGDESVLIYHLGKEKLDNSLLFQKNSGKIVENDCFLLCSDGITNALSAEEIEQLLKNKKRSSVFVSKAGKLENSDNCTAIVIYVEKAVDESEDADGDGNKDVNADSDAETTNGSEG